MREAFALQELHTFFVNRNTGIFEILTFYILTKRPLATSLVLNNRAQEFAPAYSYCLVQLTVEFALD